MRGIDLGDRGLGALGHEALSAGTDGHVAGRDQRPGREHLPANGAGWLTEACRGTGTLRDGHDRRLFCWQIGAEDLVELGRVDVELDPWFVPSARILSGTQRRPE